MMNSKRRQASVEIFSVFNFVHPEKFPTVLEIEEYYINWLYSKFQNITLTARSAGLSRTKVGNTLGKHRSKCLKYAERKINKAQRPE